MKTILVVDDTADTRDLLAVVLQGEGYGVAKAENGAAALFDINGGLRPDLILLDLLMPVLNGVEFLREFRKIAGCDRTPVLVLTAIDVDWAMLAQYGVERIITKPMDGEAMLSAIREALGE